MNLLDQIEKNHIKLENGCWEWTGKLDGCGYAVIYMCGQQFKAANINYFIKIDSIPKGLCVCHSCDNPKCINVEHLWLGTHQENMQDAVDKGRFSRGENHWQSKLKNDDIIKIFKLFNEEYYTYKEIADNFNIDDCHVYDIINNRRWAHLGLKRTYFIDNRTLHSGDNHYSNTNPEKVLKGENHWQAKLSDEQVKQIRELKESDKKNYTNKKLSILFNISETQISRIIRNESR